MALFFVGDFNGDGKAEVLLYNEFISSNWYLGSFVGNQLQWTIAGNTAGFGDLTRNAIRFFTGDFAGDGRTDVLFYCADDGNWRRGSFVGNQLQWELAGLNPPVE